MIVAKIQNNANPSEEKYCRQTKDIEKNRVLWQIVQPLVKTGIVRCYLERKDFLWRELQFGKTRLSSFCGKQLVRCPAVRWIQLVNFRGPVPCFSCQRKHMDATLLFHTYLGHCTFSKTVESTNFVCFPLAKRNNLATLICILSYAKVSSWQQ